MYSEFNSRRIDFRRGWCLEILVNFKYFRNIVM